MSANLHTIYEGDVIIFRVSTDFMSVRSRLQDAIARSLDEGYRKFVLDLKEIPRLGMREVGVIIPATASIRAKSGEMVLVLSRKNATALIQEIRLTFLATYSTVAAAVSSFSPISRSA